jgi:acyl-CoA thioesterase FadM
MAFLTIEPEIYTYDIDFNNHVSNISCIGWMEIGRLKLLEKDRNARA